MNFNISIITKFFTIIVLISHMHGLGMIDPYQEATAHNQHNELLSLPNQALRLIFSHSINTTKPLSHIIEPTLSHAIVCKSLTLKIFPHIIRIIGSQYTDKEKNRNMSYLLQQMTIFNYKEKRYIALFLTYAGANNDVNKSYSLLERAIRYNDEQMITVLFKNNVNPNQRNNTEPIFFSITTPNMAKKFIDQKVDLNAEGEIDCTPNVLWSCILHKRPLNLIKLYVENNADITKKNIDNNCLLHLLVNTLNYYANSDNYITIAQLFLKKEPKLLNTINAAQQTPLILAKKSLNSLKGIQAQYTTCLDLIKLFTEYENSHKATEYNNHHVPLLRFPDKIIKSIFEQSFDTAQPLHTIIEPTLSLSIICKKITSLLSFPKIIRTISESYTIEQKNEAMKNFLHTLPINYPGYWNKRNTGFFLTHAGAKNDAVPAFSLLANAVYHKDKQMMKVLFKNNTDPNQVCPLLESPIFFRIPTLDDIQIFIEHKVDLNATGAKASAPNVLWKCIMDEHDLELTKFYIDHKVNVALTDDKNNCLLHLLISRVRYIPETKNSVELATLFLNAAPEIINIINEDEMTPLDYAYDTLNWLAESSIQHKIFYQLIELFKKHGGKTAQQLKIMKK